MSTLLQARRAGRCVAGARDVFHVLINVSLSLLGRYVGNLDTAVTEELLLAVFGQMGLVKGCKIIHEVRRAGEARSDSSFVSKR